MKTMTFEELYIDSRDALLNAPKVNVGEWHAMDVSDKPYAATRELMGVHFQYDMPRTMEQAVADLLPNMPWAEDQFQERVGGKPLNPGRTYKAWPWQSMMDEHVEKVFSHTYMERYWPKHANEAFNMRGIRYDYGDLQDVVDMLVRSPYTRQAILPVWFPEDTGAVHGERVPCSLTYQWLFRGGKLHCIYTIRSCDFVRHFRDDLYHTTRLTQWVIDQLREQDMVVNSDEGTKYYLWESTDPGILSMNIGSLHIMEGDVRKLQREQDEEGR